MNVDDYRGLQDVLFTQSWYIWMTSSTISTEWPRLRCDSRISSEFPPLASMKLVTSSVIFWYLVDSRKRE